MEVPNFKILPMTAIMVRFPLQRLTGLFATPFPLPWMSFAEVEAYLALKKQVHRDNIGRIKDR